MTREDVLQAMRAWLASTTGLALASIVLAGEDTMRPPMPYLTVQPLSMHGPIGTGEVTYTDTGSAQTETVTGDARATVQVSAYGTSAADILDDAALKIDLPTAQAVAAALDVAIYRALSPIDRLTLRSTAMEVSAVRDFEVAYRRTTTATASPYADEIVLDINIVDTPTPPADLALTGSIDVS